jgi:hypothetical protein
MFAKNPNRASARERKISAEVAKQSFVAGKNPQIAVERNNETAPLTLRKIDYELMSTKAAEGRLRKAKLKILW